MLEELPVYVDEPAIYEPQGDHIVARWKGREFHIPIAVGQRIAVNLNMALARWRAEQCGNVAEFPARQHQAASS